MIDKTCFNLKINKKQYFKITIFCPDKKFNHKFDQVKIFFYDNDTKYLLSENDYFMPQIEPFYWRCKVILDEKRQLPPFFNVDLGYLYNKYMQDDNKEEGVNDSVDLYHYLVCSGKKYAAWLYIKNDIIFLQITPIYKWHFNEDINDKNFISYENFSKNYKSFLTIEIPRRIIQKWEKKLKCIVDKLEKSKFVCDCS